MTMENVSTRTINLDRPRRIALTLGALRRMREQDVSLEQVLQAGPDASSDPFESLGIIVWCALVNGDREDLDPTQMEEMIELSAIPSIQIALFDLIAGQQQDMQKVETSVPGAVSRGKAGARKGAGRAKK